MLHIYGCPLHYGVGTKGLTTSIDYLKKRHEDLTFPVLPEITVPVTPHGNLKNYECVLANCERIAKYAYDEILSKDEFPLFVAGDHSAAIGSVSASAAKYDNLGLIWVDAHPDINTDETSASGNIHGIPVSALLKNVGPSAKELSEILTVNQKVKPEHVAMIGLRDIDPPEAIILKELGIKYFTYDDVKKLGLDHCLTACIQHLSKLDSIHVSFDIDSVNPQILPGVSVPVADGFTLDEIHTVFRRLLTELPVKAVDIVELNAELDKDNVTTDFTYDMIKRVKQLVERP